MEGLDVAALGRFDRMTRGPRREGVDKTLARINATAAAKSAERRREEMFAPGAETVYLEVVLDAIERRR